MSGAPTPDEPTRGSRLTPLGADGLMLLAALIWGLGFIAQILGSKHLGPLSFTGLRFGLAALLLTPFVLLGRRGGWSRHDFVGGLVAGSVMALAAILQQWGMGDTTAANGGFITSTYVVIAPFFALILGHRVRWPVWLGVALVLPGLWFLSITDGYHYRGGDPFVLACAFAWAAHILLVGHWAPKVDALRFTFLQFAVTGAVGTVLGFSIERPTAEAIAHAAGALIFAAVFPTVIAFGLQTVAQRVAPPAHSAILLSFEAVFALVAGVLLLGETATQRQALGATLMFVGMLMAQVRLSSPLASPLARTPQ
jgi:drug/metabolite transporter (DMT)-like permease